MTMPGWYPDPNDPAWLNYFDGQRWTGDRQQATTPMPAQPPVQRPAQASADLSDLTMPRPASGHAAGSALPWSQPTQQPSRYEGQVPFPPGPNQAPPTGQMPQPGQVPPSAQPPLGRSPAPWAAQQDQWVGQQTGWAPQAAEWTPQPGEWGPRGRRSRRRLPLILTLSLVLVAGLLTGGWFLLHKSKTPQFTFAGKRINQPDTTLSQAEKALNVIVAQRHGAKDADTRCYFATPSAPPKGTRKTDVDTAVRCGPVLFVDGDPHRTYLSFALTSAASEHGSVSAAAASAPISADPSALPDSLTLSRPDGKTPPNDGGLQVPPPPPAANGALVAAFLTGQSLPDAPRDALMASLRGGVKLTKVGVVKRYGSGDNARSAPAGQRLVAFTYTSVAGQIGNVSPTRSETGLSVNGHGSRRLPSPAKGQVIVAAVPTGARADLVLYLDHIRQTISLPDGKPGPTNLAVLRRSHIDARLSVNKPMTIRFTQGGASANLSGRVTATHALIGYWTDDAKHHASSGSKALLWMDFRFRVPNQTDQTGVDAPLLTIRPSGGAPIRAKDLDRSDKVFAVFEVPATFTRGTVTISGKEPGSTSITVVTPVKFTVSIAK